MNEIYRRYLRFVSQEKQGPTHLVVSPEKWRELMGSGSSLVDLTDARTIDEVWTVFGMRVHLAPVDDEIFLC